MANETSVSVALLEAFNAAFNRHDTEALMSMMTEDCIFEGAAGPEVYGVRFEGREAVANAFAKVWETFPDAHWADNGGGHWVQGDYGVSQWRFSGTRADGARIEADGCDLFTFRAGKIAVKKAFRKERPLQNLPKA